MPQKLLETSFKAEIALVNLVPRSLYRDTVYTHYVLNILNNHSVKIMFKWRFKIMVSMDKHGLDQHQYIVWLQEG
jgi:hypothetical protein